MIRFRSLTAGVLVAGLLAGGAAFAQGPGLNTGPRGDNPGPGVAGGRGGRGAGGPGGPGELGLPLQQLNLSDAQRQQIRDIVQRRLDAGRDVQQRLRAAQDAQRQAVETLPVNEGAIRAAAQNLGLAEAEAAVQQAHLRADVFSILTPDQQAQVARLVAERGSRAGQRRDRQDDRRARVQDRLQQRQQ